MLEDFLLLRWIKALRTISHITACGTDQLLFDRAASDLLPKPTRGCILCWMPGRNRGIPGAIEQQIAGLWHSVALQESSEYMDADVTKNEFHIARHLDLSRFSYVGSHSAAKDLSRDHQKLDAAVSP